MWAARWRWASVVFGMFVADADDETDVLEQVVVEFGTEWEVLQWAGFPAVGDGDEVVVRGAAGAGERAAMDADVVAIGAGVFGGEVCRPCGTRRVFCKTGIPALTCRAMTLIVVQHPGHANRGQGWGTFATPTDRNVGATGFFRSEINGR